MSGLFIFAVSAGFGYLFSLRVHPYPRCHSRKGAGRHRGRGVRLRHPHVRDLRRERQQLRLGVRLLLGGTEKK